MPGVCSAGLNTTALPVTSAAVTMPAGSRAGSSTARSRRRRRAARRSTRCASPGAWPSGTSGAEAQRLAAVVLAEVDRLAHVGVGFGDRLAGLEDLERGQLGAPSRAGSPRRGTAPRLVPPATSRAMPATRAAATSSAASAIVGRRRGRCGTRPGRCRPGRPRRSRRRVATARPSTSTGASKPSRADGIADRRASGRSRAAAGAARRAARWRTVPGAPGSVGSRTAAVAAVGRRARRRRAGGADELVEVAAFGEAMAHEALVGRVLEQPPHEVGHARNQLADRRVHAHPVARRARAPRAPARPCRTAAGARGAVGPSSHRARRRDRVGEAAQVVARDRRAAPRRRGRSGTCVQRSKLASVSAFCANTGNGHPAAPATIVLVVPVGALDQPDLQRDLELVRRPRDQVAKIVVGVPPVRLDHAAQLHVGILARPCAAAARSRGPSPRRARCRGAPWRRRRGHGRAPGARRAMAASNASGPVSGGTAVTSAVGFTETSTRGSAPHGSCSRCVAGRPGGRRRHQDVEQLERRGRRSDPLRPRSPPSRRGGRR